MKTYCFFSAHYLPHLGGVERYTYNLSRQLVFDDNRVIIVTSDVKGEPDFEDKEGMVIVRISSIHLMNDRLPIIKLTKGNSKVYRYLKSQKIDYVIINTKFYPISYLGAVFAKKQNIPSLVIEHGTGHLKFNRCLVTKIGELYEHVMAKLIYSKCKQFAGVSRACIEWLGHFGVWTDRVLYNAVDYDKIQSMGCGKQDAKRKIVFTGRIIEEKGICKLLKAFQMVEKRYDDIQLYVLGDGDLLDGLKKQYNNDKNIVFTGKVDFEEVVSILKNAEIYCFPTDYPEGLPTCVLEAMACGVYTITTGAGGAKEVIVNDRYGKIIDNNTEENIEKELLFALENNDYREQVALNGKNRVKEKFDWKMTKDDLVFQMKKIEEAGVLEVKR